MIINHRKPSLNQGIFRPSPSPSPFNSHILIVIVLITYFVLLVLVLPREQVSLPTKYNPPSYIQDTTFNWNTRYIRFLILLKVSLLYQRALISVWNLFTTILSPLSAFNLPVTLAKSYLIPFTTSSSRHKCHSTRPVLVLLRTLVLTMTLVDLKTQ